MQLLGWLVVVLCSLAALPAQVQQRPNVLLIVADDLGIDAIGCYGTGPAPAATPNIDQLAAGGVRFTRAIATPACSPSRACLQTARYPFRTGIGVGVLPGRTGLQPSEWLLPEMMGAAGYATGAIGKWHLGDALGPSTPNSSGWTRFAGNLHGYLPNYTNWTKVVDGAPLATTTYATSDNVDEALQWIQARQGPWCLMLAFDAPHAPYHVPPAHLHARNLAGLDPQSQPLPFYKAMVEALDTEIGRLLAGIPPAELANTNIVFTSDNGTPPEVTELPLRPWRAKGTLYQGGIRVPLVVKGPAVVNPGRTSAALVDMVDLMPTVAAMAQVPPGMLAPAGTVTDGQSFLPVLTDTVPSVRTWSYSEQFMLHATSGFAIQNARYKLIRFTWWWYAYEELYDLQLDPLEQNDLLQCAMNDDQIAALRALRSEAAFLRQPQPQSVFGAGCPGSAGPVVLQAPAGAPRIGNTHTLTASPIAANSPYSVGVIGFSRDQSSIGPLPFDLSLVGMTDCQLWIDPASIDPVSLQGTTGTWAIPIPNQFSLVGVQFFQQVLVSDPAANAGGAIATHAMCFRIGL